MGIIDKLKGFVRTVTGRVPSEPQVQALTAAPFAKGYGTPINVVSGRRVGGKSMLAAKLQALQRLVVPDPPYRRSTTALRRFQRDANRQYLHVSVPITHEIQRLVTLFGERWFRRAHKGKGITYYRGQANG